MKTTSVPALVIALAARLMYLMIHTVPWRDACDIS